jgi:RND family efflux transporter MFP subunit
MNEKQERVMNPQWRYTVPLLVLVFCAMALVGCKEERTGKPVSQDGAAVPVKVFTVREEKAMSHVEIMGTVQAAERAVIAARISGTIIELPVIPGSRVNKGDLLVRINAGEIAAQVLQAKAQLAQVERNLEREQSLLKKSASTPETVKALEDTRRIALASLKEAQTMLDYAAITAPFSGIITRKNADVGDLAVPGKPLLEIENVLKLQVAADIPESMILNIKVGDDIPISIPAAGFSSICKVEEVSPSADPLSRTAPIKLSLSASPDIRSGQFARLLLPQDTSNALFIPRSAIMPFGQMERIFLVQDDRARLRLVRTGAIAGEKVEILAGLSSGDEVVIEGNADLTDGQHLTISR